MEYLVKKNSGYNRKYRDFLKASLFGKFFLSTIFCHPTKIQILCVGHPENARGSDP